MTETNTTPHVYAAICAVAGDLASEGIAKDRKNSQGSGYMFRGIDDVYNALAPLLAKHGLCILPRFLERAVEERSSKSGGTLFYVCLRGEFDFVSKADGSRHTVSTFGEAMDSGDKATNKAMSAAYKYAAFQAFSIPTEGDNDADASTPLPVTKRAKAGWHDGLRNAGVDLALALEYCRKLQWVDGSHTLDDVPHDKAEAVLKNLEKFIERLTVYAADKAGKATPTTTTTTTDNRK